MPANIPLFPDRIGSYVRGMLGRPPVAREAVLRLIRDQGQISLTDLAAARGKSRASVGGQLRALEKMGLIVVVSKRPRVVGPVTSAPAPVVEQC